MQKFIISSLICFFMINLPISSQTETSRNKIFGYVFNTKNEPLTGANVYLKDTNIGTATDKNGYYIINNIPDGKYMLLASMIGYRVKKILVDVHKNKSKRIDFILRETFLEFNSIVVTGTASPYLYKESPVKTEVISKKLIGLMKACNLAEALSMQNNVNVENDCQNCNFTQVRLLGFEGKYTQILIDGDPVVNSLAGVYALEHFPEEMIDRIEIIKGGGSALYGSGSIAGSINLLTKIPKKNYFELSALSTTISGSLDNNAGFSCSIISKEGQGGAFVYGAVRKREHYDKNNDGFSELGELENQTLGINWIYKISNNEGLTISLNKIHENRRGGNKFDLPPHEADIAESVEHNRYGGKIKWKGLLKNHLIYKLYTAFSLLNRNSYYGGLSDLDSNGIITNDEIGFSSRYYGNSKDNTIITGARGIYRLGVHKFTLGTEYYYDHLIDKTTSNIKFHENKIYGNLGFFLQDEFSLNKGNINSVIGVRFDKNSELNYISINPRINVKAELKNNFVTRIGFSTGFRAPQIFDEDLHIESLGGLQRIIKNIPNLRAEKSYSYSLNFSYDGLLGENPFLLGVTFYYTDLTNAFSLVKSNLNSENMILWTRINSDGAYSYGYELDMGYKPFEYFELRSGITHNIGRYKSPQEIFHNEFTSHFLKSPDYTGFFRLLYTGIKGLSIFSSIKYTGFMIVANERLEKLIKTNKAFVEINIGTDYLFSLSEQIRLNLSVGAKNILDSYQKDLEIGRDRDPSYVYGPQLPRRFYLGAKLMLN